MSSSRRAMPVINLCSPEKGGKADEKDALERPHKRVRTNAAAASNASDGVVDLCESPVAIGVAPAQGAGGQPEGGQGGLTSTLWGEFATNQPPPRWRAVRRRTGPRTGRGGDSPSPSAGQQSEPSHPTAQQWLSSVSLRCVPDSPGHCNIATVGRVMVPYTLPVVDAGAPTTDCRGSATNRGASGSAGSVSGVGAAPLGRINRRGGEPTRSLRDLRGDASREQGGEEYVISDAELARRLQQEEQREAHTARLANEARLSRRLVELERLEAAFESSPFSQLSDHGPPGWQLPGRHFNGDGGAAAAAAMSHSFSDPRARRVRGNGGGWGHDRLASSFLGMLAGGMPFAPAFGGPPVLAGAHSAAHSAAMGVSSRLPLQLLFTDRDFNEDDYEMLLKLDEGVENRKGASKRDIERMPTEVVTQEPALEKEDDPRCSICLEEVEVGCVLRTLPCKHKFHKACIDTWLQHKAACPICQRCCKRK